MLNENWKWNYVTNQNSNNKLYFSVSDAMYQNKSLLAVKMSFIWLSTNINFTYVCGVVLLAGKIDCPTTLENDTGNPAMQKQTIGNLVSKTGKLVIASWSELAQLPIRAELSLRFAAWTENIGQVECLQSHVCLLNFVDQFHLHSWIWYCSNCATYWEWI